MLLPGHGFLEEVSMVARVKPSAVKDMLSDGREIAFFDVREGGEFGDGHPFFRGLRTL